MVTCALKVIQRRLAILGFARDLVVLGIVSWNLANLAGLLMLGLYNSFMIGKLVVRWVDSQMRKLRIRASVPLGNSLGVDELLVPQPEMISTAYYSGSSMAAHDDVGNSEEDSELSGCHCHTPHSEARSQAIDLDNIDDSCLDDSLWDRPPILEHSLTSTPSQLVLITPSGSAGEFLPRVQENETTDTKKGFEHIVGMKDLGQPTSEKTQIGEEDSGISDLIDAMQRLGFESPSPDHPTPILTTRN
ncbi:hypothetical protein FRC11_008499 [Ceratobasidium sp. 423]|nr:hypothetical protein FRC11_008499 [Ceratobasidium sp. 423]